jgi:hypothetical protein
VNDDPLPLRILGLRAQIAELSGIIRQLQRSRLDDATPRLLVSRKRAELEDLSRRSRLQDDLSSAPRNNAVQEKARLIATAKRE